MSLPFTEPRPIGEFDVARVRQGSGSEFAKDVARMTFAEIGELPMVVLLFGRRIPPWWHGEEEPGDAKDLLWLCHLKESNEQTKALFAKALPFVAKALGAVAIANAFEAWTTHVDAGSHEEVVKKRAAMPADLGDLPGRQEAVVVSYETATVQELWSAPIHRTSAGVRLACFEKAPTAVHAGRFVGILAPIDAPTRA